MDGAASLALSIKQKAFILIRKTIDHREGPYVQLLLHSRPEFAEKDTFFLGAVLGRMPCRQI